MRYYGYSIDAMFQSKEQFLFSILPMIGLERDNEIWALHLSWLNMAFTLFTGIDDGEEDGNS